MNSNQTHQPTQSIALLQYNLNKSKPTTYSVLNNPISSKYTILMLQEQYFSNYTNKSLTHHSWTLIESKRMGNNPPQAAIYINKTILPAHSYKPIPMETPNIVAVTIRLNQEQHLTLIINIYNTKNTLHLTELQMHLQKHLQNHTYNRIIAAGDFNLHYPLWNLQNYHVHNTEADTFIDTMSQIRLKPMLPAGTITFPRAKTAIDLVWGNNYVEQRLIKCRIARTCNHSSDHHPVETVLNLQPCPYRPEAQQPYNYKKTDWKTFKEKLKNYLPTLNHTTEPTAETVDKLVNDISMAIRRTTTETTP